MSGFPLVRFVAAPDPSAEVRFDFQADPGYVSVEGFSLGAPTLEGTKYGPRQITVPTVVGSTKARALPVLSALMRELARRDNWLLYQASAASAPVWFRTYQAAPGEIDFESVWDDDLRRDVWQITVDLEADGLAYGERVLLPDVTVNNDPAAGTNPMSFTLPPIIGDAPAPMTFALYPGAQVKIRALISAMAVPDTFDGPYCWQSSEFTAETDTGAEVASATHSGGGYRSVSFATTPGMAERLSGAIPTKPPAGRYKILARVGRSDTSSTFDVKLTLGSSEGRTVRVSGTSNTATWATVVDLGEFDLPTGGGAELPYGLSVFDYQDITASFSAARITGAGALHIDYLIAIPIKIADQSARTLIIGNAAAGEPWTAIYVDGGLERIGFGYLPNVYDLALSGPTSTMLVGDFPAVVPGETDVVHFVLHTDSEARIAEPFFGSDGNDDVITETIAVTHLSYRPRWLNLPVA